MKVKLLISLCILFAGCEPERNAVEKDYHVGIGGENVRLVFADETLKDDFKSQIADDLNLLLGVGCRKKVNPYSVDDDYVFLENELSNDEVKDPKNNVLWGKVIFHKQKKYPKKIREWDVEKYYLNPATGKPEIPISEKTIGMYRKAIRFKRKHKREIRKLTRFLEMIDNDVFDVEKMSEKEKENLFRFDSEGAEMRKYCHREGWFDAFLASLNEGFLHSPSLLFFREEKIGQNGGKENPYVTCECFLSKNEHPRHAVNVIGLIYDGKEWKIRVR